MKSFPFFKLSPCGNTTILIPEHAIAEKNKQIIAKTILLPTHIQAEQVGFINMEKASLAMAGGEFCVNATRAFGALLAEAHSQGAIAADAPFSALVTVSGMAEPVRVIVSGCRPLWQVDVELELASLPPCLPVGQGMVLVRLSGIDHLLIDDSIHPMPENWLNAAAALRREHHLEESEAAGCIWWRQTKQGVSMKPVVWVRACNSTFLESACGSGALACVLGLPFLYKAAQEQAIALLQPSQDILTLRLRKNAHSWQACVGGSVALVAEGQCYMQKEF
jgi:diaminopimelate epimerase